ncbi:MAG: hypothetical protein NXI13_13870 [Proteobacteria bacterium]|nr:hypothetical protein [Pseudomonadota bacterium]
MADWNFDMTAAPKGKTRTVRSGKKSMREIHSQDRIMTLGQDNKVRPSYWDREREAWAMYSEKFPPVGWQPYPDPPKAVPEHIRAILNAYQGASND